MHAFWSNWTGVEGAAHCRAGSPAFTYTNTFFNVPFAFTTVSSAITCPLCCCAHAGTASMLIAREAGFSPEKLTFPLIVASAAGSAAGAGASAFFSSGLEPPPHEEVKSITPAKAAGKNFETSAIRFIIVFNRCLSL